MTKACDEYHTLMREFLAGKMPAAQFQSMYLDKFQSDSRHFDESTFQLLDEAFGCVDSFCADPQLLAELQLELPDFYLDEQTLRRRIADISERLLQSTRAAGG